MYESYFGLSEKPFTIAPDPRYVYLSAAHEEALAHLLYGVSEGGGFVQLTGEVGTGKTTLVRTLLEQLPEHVDLALVFNPKLSPLEFTAAICDELEIPYDADKASLKTLVDSLNAHLFDAYSEGYRTVLIIDEAQGLSVDVLEQVRLLTNLETTREKLLQIILVGQPELRQMLARSDLRQLAQRITARYHLESLRHSELRDYLGHRLAVAGSNRNLYRGSAVRALYKVTGGIPRLINEIADRSLLAAYVQEKSEVDGKMVREAAHQVLGSSNKQKKWFWWSLFAGVVLLFVAAATYWWLELKPTPMVSAVPSVTESEMRPERDAAIPEDSALLIENGVSRPYRIGAPDETLPEPATKRSKPASTQKTVSLVQDEPDMLTAPSLALETWLAEHASEVGRADAFNVLFSLWNLPAMAETDQPCEYAVSHQMRCYSASGNWTRLAEMNRPAVVVLQQFGSASSYLPVVAVDGESVALRIGDDVRQFERREIDRLWLGEFELLWPAPAGIEDGGLTPGDSGAAVIWLRERMKVLTGIEIVPDREAEKYDEQLARVVRMFQMANNLEPDATLNEQTVIRLTANSGPNLHEDQ